MAFIPALKTLRLKLGLSQAELARRADVDRATIYRCETGYFVTDLSCAKINAALESEALQKRIPLGEIEIKDGGKNGSNKN